jgi:hypothetical protein
MRIVRNDNSNLPDRCRRGITPRAEKRQNTGTFAHKSATGVGAVPPRRHNSPSTEVA